MTREAQIPLFLWIATAVVAHLLWGGGADRVSDVIEEGVEIREFAASVRRFVRGESRPVEITLLDESEAAKQPDPTAPEERTDDATPPDQKSAEKDEAAKPLPQKLDEKSLTEPKRAPEKEKPPEPEKKKEPDKPDEKQPVELPKDEAKKRIAVRQNVEDPEQKDNPNADFIADNANHVKEQTQARITSTDQNDPQPTAGAAAKTGGSERDPGNSDTTRILQSEDRAGEKNRAPGAEAAKPELRIAEIPAPARPPGAAGTERVREGAKTGSPNADRSSKLPGETGQTPQPALREAEAVPDTLDSARGTWEIPGERAGAFEQSGRVARKKRALPPLRSAGRNDLLGLGAAGLTPGGFNLNLSPEIAVATIGKDQLVRERRADGERRRSQHAGKWRPAGIERWRAAIENYVAMVKPGNQTALNTARVPFASYLNQIHVRLHPIFADTFLASLDDLPSSHPMNRDELSTNLEIVLDRDEGRIQRMGVTKTSGVTAFDIAALESVHRAQPFGTPPREIVSPDGNVYFHWEFHRDRNVACTTYHARPFILKAQPKSVPPELEPEPQPDSDTKERHGSTPKNSSRALARADGKR